MANWSCTQPETVGNELLLLLPLVQMETIFGFHFACCERLDNNFIRKWLHSMALAVTKRAWTMPRNGMKYRQIVIHFIYIHSFTCTFWANVLLSCASVTDGEWRFNENVCIPPCWNVRECWIFLLFGRRRHAFDKWRWRRRYGIRSQCRPIHFIVKYILTLRFI